MNQNFQQTVSRPVTGRDGAGAQASEFLTLPAGCRKLRHRDPEGAGDPGLRSSHRDCHAPEFIKGVVNLRGVIVPILDLRVKFRLSQADYDEFTVVIILNVAERVSAWWSTRFPTSRPWPRIPIRPTAEFASATFDTRYITGLATVDERC